MASYMNLGKTLIQAAPNIAPTLLADGMRRLLDMAIDGYQAVPGAKAHAAALLNKHRDVDKAINALVTQHLAMASAQGFLTNVGGVITLAVSLPANAAGLAFVQTRMVAAIAHLRGHDVDDPRVRTAIAMCLLGRDMVDDLVRAQQLPSTPLGVATAPVSDPELDRQVDEKVMSQLLAVVGSKRVALLTLKRVPLIGGGIGAATDSIMTWGIAQFAKESFVSRRRHIEQAKDETEDSDVEE